MTQDYDDHEYVSRVGESHPALVIIGDGYDKETAPEMEEVRQLLDEKSEWGLSSIYEIREGPVEIQHEAPPTDPYDAWGVVVAFEQSNVVNDWEWDGPMRDAQNLIFEEFENVEIWIDAI